MSDETFKMFVVFSLMSLTGVTLGSILMGMIHLALLAGGVMLLIWIVKNTTKNGLRTLFSWILFTGGIASFVAMVYLMPNKNHAFAAFLVSIIFIFSGVLTLPVKKDEEKTKDLTKSAE